MSKRGQITVFIILGLLMIVGVVLFTYITSRESTTSTQPTSAQVGSGQDIVQSVNSYVINCLRAELAPLVWEMGAKGATLSPRKDVHDRRQVVVDAWCNEDAPGSICTNRARTRESVEAELATLLQERLREGTSCLATLDDVVKGGAVQVLSPPTVIITMNPLDMVVRLQFHFKAQFSDAEQEFNEFVTTERIPFGRMVQVATDIVNKEATTSIFNKDQWMFSNGSDILIQKERPYPDVIYNLSTHVPAYETVVHEGEQLGPLILTFAVEGQDTAGITVRRLKRTAGCCIAPTGGCKANVPASECAAVTYDDDLACTCPAQAQPVVEGCCQLQDKSCSVVTEESKCAEQQGTFYAGDRACRQPEIVGGVTQACTNMGCADLAYNYDDTYGARRHGDSWCTQDTITGFGMDMVGSRHYVHSCINGKEYVEPCRDFREEICVGKTDQATQSLVATCKLNRWYDCANQRSQGSCEDLGTRDCMWLPKLKINGKVWAGKPENHPAVLHAKKQCVPWVPPGFRFWKPLAQNKAVCAQVNQHPIFNPGPRAQGFSILRICANLGDCGNKRNYVGELTKKGYSNPVGKPKKWHYDKYTAEHFENPLKKSSFVRAAQYERMYNLFRQIFGWMPDATWEEVMSVEVDANVQIATRLKNGAIKCKPWVPPTGTHDCGLCDDDPLRPCTEYRCRALGQCKWNWDDGLGTCDAYVASGDTTGPVVDLNVQSLPQALGLSAQPNPIATPHKSYTITPPLLANQRVAFTITTSEDAVCGASFFDQTQPSFEDFNPELDPIENLVRAATLAAFEIPISGGSSGTTHNVDMVIPSLQMLQDAIEKVPGLNLAPLPISIPVWISCEDEDGNRNANDLIVTLQFDPSRQVDDAREPSITEAKVTTDDDDIQVLRIIVNEAILECRIGDTTQLYDEMTTTVCTDSLPSIGFEGGLPGHTVCDVTPVPSLAVDSIVQCKDLAGNPSASMRIER